MITGFRQGSDLVRKNIVRRLWRGGVCGLGEWKSSTNMKTPLAERLDWVGKWSLRWKEARRSVLAHWSKPPVKGQTSWRFSMVTSLHGFETVKAHFVLMLQTRCLMKLASPWTLVGLAQEEAMRSGGEAWLAITLGRLVDGELPEEADRDDPAWRHA